MYIKAILICLMMTTFSGCATDPERNNEQVGMVIGGIIGAAVGTQIGEGSGTTVAIIAGTLIGSTIGGNIGRSMDTTDRMKTAQSLESVRNGVPSSWKNPDTGHQYTVVPTRTYEKSSGPCREYTVDAVIGGKNEKLYGTACRQSDGSWKVQSN